MSRWLIVLVLTQLAPMVWASSPKPVESSTGSWDSLVVKAQGALQAVSSAPRPTKLSDREKLAEKGTSHYDESLALAQKLPDWKTAVEKGTAKAELFVRTWLRIAVAVRSLDPSDAPASMVADLKAIGGKAFVEALKNLSPSEQTTVKKMLAQAGRDGNG